MLRIIIDVNAPTGMAIGVKEAFAMDAEKYGDVVRVDVREVVIGREKLLIGDGDTYDEIGTQYCLLACEEAKSGAWVDITQGADARLLTEDNVAALNRIRLKMIHFAWDDMEQSAIVLRGLELYRKRGNLAERNRRVYVLTNYSTTMEENIYRIYHLRELGFDPYVMIYDKPHAPREIKQLQRWVNSKFIWRICEKFEDYQGGLKNA